MHAYACGKFFTLDASDLLDAHETLANTGRNEPAKYLQIFVAQ